MILEHSVSLLTTGHSSAAEAAHDAYSRVLFKLQSGVAARRLDGLKTAFMMIELIKEAGTRKLDSQTMFRLFDNFVSYIWGRFPEPLCMALIKYAVADRNVTIKKLAECKSWSKISGTFKPVMLDNSKDPSEVQKYARFERLHQRLKRCKPVSVALQEYVQSEFANVHVE